MSDQYAELRQAIVALKQKYPELLYREGQAVYTDDDGFYCVCFEPTQKPVGIITNGRLVVRGSFIGMPIHMDSSGEILVSHTNRPGIVLGVVTAVDQNTSLATIQLNP